MWLSKSWQSIEWSTVEVARSVRCTARCIFGVIWCYGGNIANDWLEMTQFFAGANLVAVPVGADIPVPLKSSSYVSVDSRWFIMIWCYMSILGVWDSFLLGAMLTVSTSAGVDNCYHFTAGWVLDCDRIQLKRAASISVYNHYVACISVNLALSVLTRDLVA